MLLSLYTVLAVAVTTRVLTKWKTIAFELLLKHERGREQMSIDVYEAESNSSNSSRSGNISSAADMQLAYSSGSASGGSNDRSGAAVGVTGVITREGAGGMLSVEMRPRSPAAAAEAAAAAAAMNDDASGDADAQEEGISESIGPVSGFTAAAGAAAGSSAAGGGADGFRGAGSSSSSRRQRSGKWFVGKSADDLERLLLPLDG
jgi:hypothetical protein